MFLFRGEFDEVAGSDNLWGERISGQRNKCYNRFLAFYI